MHLTRTHWFMVGVLAVTLLQGCQILVDGQVQGVACEQEGLIGAPACPQGSSCQLGSCVRCLDHEICDDGIDNDCNLQIDDTCEEAGAPIEAGSDAHLVSNLDARTQNNLVVLYSFLEGEGDVIHDVSGQGEPLDITIETPNTVSWQPEGGLQIVGPSRIASKGSALKIYQACKSFNAITVEAWIRTASLEQSGPAWIVSMSADSITRNFDLGQDHDEWVFDLRSKMSGPRQLFSLTANPLDEEIHHVVYVRNNGGFAHFTIDNTPEDPADAGGDFGNWQDSFRLVFGNDLANRRPWLGTLYLVAIYSRGLEPSAIENNYGVGIPRTWLE